MKKIISIISCVMCAVVLTIPAFSQAEVNSPSLSSYSEWKNDSGEVSFPVDFYENEKLAFDSYAEKMKFYCIPEYLLENMSTDNILNLITLYPLMTNLYAYDTLQDGYEVLKKDFNGFEAFLKRDDCADVLLERYANLNIPKTTLVDYEALIHDDTYVQDINAILKDEELCNKVEYDVSVKYANDIMELLIADIVKSQGLSQIQTDTLVVVFEDNMEKKQESDYFSGRNNILAEEISTFSNDNSIKAAFNQAFVGSSSSSSRYLVYTPGDHTPVWCDYKEDGGYIKHSTVIGLAHDFNAMVVSEALDSFNCHSFAWLQDDYSDIYQYLWMNSANAFATDSAYIEKSSATKTNDIAYYTFGKHSAIVIDLSVYNPKTYRPEPKMVSKWGDGAIYIHLLTNCPYDWDDMEYFERR